MATDQEIRAAGYYNIPQQKYLQNPFVLPTTPTTTETAPTQNFGIPYTNAFTGGGDGGGGGGFGTWGNLDKGSGKWFQVEGYDGPIRGYKNVNTGLYQDEDGLNIQNLGIGSFGLMGMLENAMGWDKKEPKYPGFFQQHNIRDIGKMRKFFEKQDIKKWRASEKAKAEKLKADNLKAVQQDAAATQAAKTGPARSHTGEAIAAGDLRDIGKTGFHEYKDAATSSKYEGSMREGGRARFFYGGIATAL